MDELKVCVVKFSDRSKLMLKYIDPITRKQRYKSSGTTSRKDAGKAAGRWESELRQGIVGNGRTTWATFRQRYEDEVLASLAPTTDKKVQCVFNAIEKHLAPAQLRSITSERVSHLQSK